jgi:hypothetical protein
LHYPNGWTASSSNLSYIASIADPKNSTISVLVEKQQLSSGSDTQQAHSNLVNSMSPTQIITATAACSLGGNPAYETYFISKSQEFRVTSLQKDNFLYSVVCSAPPDVFVKNQANFDIIVNSFRLQ